MLPGELCSYHSSCVAEIADTAVMHCIALHLGASDLCQEIVCVASCSLKQLVKPFGLIFVTMVDKGSFQILPVVVMGVPVAYA